MWTRDDDRFEIPLDKLEDDLTWTKRGVSFIDNPANGLQDREHGCYSKRSPTRSDARCIRMAGG